MEKVLVQKKIAINGLKYVAILLLIIPLSNAQIYGVKPFGSAFFASLIFVGLPFVAIAPMYILAESVASLSIYALINSIICATIIFFSKLLIMRFKEQENIIKPIAVLLSQMGLIVFAKYMDNSVLRVSLSIVLTVAFSFATTHGLTPIVKDKLRYKLNEVEILTLALIAVVVSMGLSAFNLQGFELYMTVGVFFTLTASYLSGVGACVIVAGCFGVGSALNSYSIVPIALMIFIAIVAGIFVHAPRILSTFSAVVALVAFVFYFNVDYDKILMQMASVLTGGIVYLLVPTSLLKSVRDFVFESHERTAVRFMINKNRLDISNDLKSSSHIFLSMADALKNKPYDLPQFKGALKAKCCKKCENCHKCDCVELDESLDDMVAIALQKGRVSVQDIPDYISNNCIYLARLISACGEFQESYKAAIAKQESDTSATRLVCSQLFGMSEILKNLAFKSQTPVFYDNNREKVIVEELNFSGVIAAQALVTDSSIAIIIRTETINKKIIEKKVSDIMRVPYKVSQIDDTMIAGFCAVALTPSPKYDIVFGLAGVPKVSGQKSGDTHSFIKIGNNKFMMALCDGMGTGEKAEEISDTAITLVENFYKAGFDSDLVLQSVNRFLSLRGGEGFSALDICVIDLDTATADIIKLASPATIIKKKDTIEEIHGHALPMGIIEQAEPFIKTIDLTSGDMIVLSSDGITDVFEEDKLGVTINNLQTVNPQVLSENILDHALSISRGVPKDDSTVVCARIIQRL